MSLVLDASITIARFHEDEVTPGIYEVFKRVEASGAHAPPFWKVEIANVLQMKVRKQRYDSVERDRLLGDIGGLGVVIDMAAPQYLWTTTLQLAHRHQLTVYDAIYLESALRLGLPLATLDRELASAAQAEGVTVLGV